MEQDQLPCASPVQCGSDREAFERVWRRVMPEPRPDCPFTLYGEDSAAGAEEVLTPPAAGTMPRVPAQPAAPMMPSMPAAPSMPAQAAVPGCVPAVPTTPALPAVPSPRQEMELLPENDVPCLGCASSVYGSLLQAFIADEISDWRTYQALARRMGGAPGRTLAGIAADERRHAKRLSTAYFLISGVQYWPDKLPAAPGGAILGALRSRFAGEQRGEAAYRAAAGSTADPCLRELYLELAGDENEHAWLIRGILEQM